MRAEHRHNRHEREARTARVQAGCVERGFEGREQRQDTHQGLGDPVRIHERPAVHGPGVRIPADERRAEIINSSAPPHTAPRHHRLTNLRHYLRVSLLVAANRYSISLSFFTPSLFLFSHDTDAVSTRSRYFFR